MPNFTAYPTVKTTPNRKQRKAKRSVVFAANKAAYSEARKARRKARKGAEDKI